MKLSEAVELFVALRDKKAQLKAEMDELIKPIQAKMDAIEGKLLAAFDKQGVDSCRTSQGTAYVATRTSSSVADKEVFLDFCKSVDGWDYLEVRASKDAVTAYVEEHQTPPPGVNLRTERVVNFRRS